MNAWQARFETPTVDALLQDLPEQARAQMNAVRKRLGRSQAKWSGSTWQWCIQVEHPGGMVLLIPDPDSPRIAIPVPGAAFAESPPAPPVSAMLLSAVSVGDTVWTEWSLAKDQSGDAILDALSI